MVCFIHEYTALESEFFSLVRIPEIRKWHGLMVALMYSDTLQSVSVNYGLSFSAQHSLALESRSTVIFFKKNLKHERECAGCF